MPALSGEIRMHLQAPSLWGRTPLNTARGVWIEHRCQQHKIQAGPQPPRGGPMLSFGGTILGCSTNFSSVSTTLKGDAAQEMLPSSTSLFIQHQQRPRLAPFSGAAVQSVV